MRAWVGEDNAGPFNELFRKLVNPLAGRGRRQWRRSRQFWREVLVVPCSRSVTCRRSTTLLKSQRSWGHQWRAPTPELARATQLLSRRNGPVVIVGGADRSRSAIGVPRRGSDSHRGAGERTGSRSPGGQANPEGILDAAPIVADATAPVHRGHAASGLRASAGSSELEHYGEATIKAPSSVLACSRGASVGPPTKASIGVAGVGASCPGHLCSKRPDTKPDPKSAHDNAQSLKQEEDHGG
jgi:hypothetical protein